MKKTVRKFFYVYVCFYGRMCFISLIIVSVLRESVNLCHVDVLKRVVRICAVKLNS